MKDLINVWVQEIGDLLHVYEGGVRIATCYEDDLDGVIVDLNIGSIYLWLEENNNADTLSL